MPKSPPSSERLEHDDPSVIVVYTDGSCWPNPNGLGGWSFFCSYLSKHAIRYGFSESSTNNEMELMAILHALRYVPITDSPLVIYTDSKYCRNAITDWVIGWKESGWKTASGSDVKNLEIIQEIHNLFNHHLSHRRLELRWVRGHSGIPENELVDQWANHGRTNQETNWKRSDHRTKCP